MFTKPSMFEKVLHSVYNDLPLLFYSEEKIKIIIIIEITVSIDV